MTRFRIETMQYGGLGVARTSDGIETRLPFVLPGELVEVTPANELAILERSSDRISPACIHFGACGGCHYQHAAYPAQLRIKEEVLRETLTAAGLDDLPPIQVHSGPGRGYRNRIRLRVGEAAGEVRLGYNRRESLEADTQPVFLPITMCLIAAPVLWRAVEALTLLANNPSTSASIGLWVKAAVEAELFADAWQKKVQLTLFVRNPPRQGFADLCNALKQRLPELAGAGVAILPAQSSGRSRRTERPKAGPVWGAPGMLYDVAYTDATVNEYWITRGSFFQVNLFLIEALAQIVTSGRSGNLAWDLYAGVGLFSRALAGQFQYVVAVEGAEPAATDLRAALNSATNGKSHQAVRATTVEFLLTAVVQRERPDLIVMDPPRAGIGLEACSLLARIRAPEMVYVSCDPVTLARDLRQLIDSGCTLQQLHLVDMFPQTFHQETVAVLIR